MALGPVEQILGGVFQPRGEPTGEGCLHLVGIKSGTDRRFAQSCDDACLVDPTARGHAPKTVGCGVEGFVPCAHLCAAQIMGGTL